MFYAPVLGTEPLFLQFRPFGIASFFLQKNFATFGAYSASFGAPARDHVASAQISCSSCCRFSFLLVHQRLFHIGDFFEVSQLFLQLFLSLIQLLLDVNLFIHLHLPIFFKPAFFTCWFVLNPLLLLCILVPLELFTNLCLRVPVLLILCST